MNPMKPISSHIFTALRKLVTALVSPNRTHALNQAMNQSHRKTTLLSMPTAH